MNISIHKSSRVSKESTKAPNKLVDIWQRNGSSLLHSLIHTQTHIHTHTCTIYGWEKVSCYIRVGGPPQYEPVSTHGAASILMNDRGPGREESTHYTDTQSSAKQRGGMGAQGVKWLLRLKRERAWGREGKGHESESSVSTECAGRVWRMWAAPERRWRRSRS